MANVSSTTNPLTHDHRQGDRGDQIAVRGEARLRPGRGMATVAPSTARLSRRGWTFGRANSLSSRALADSTSPANRARSPLRVGPTPSAGLTPPGSFAPAGSEPRSACSTRGPHPALGRWPVCRRGWCLIGWPSSRPRPAETSSGWLDEPGRRRQRRRRVRCCPTRTARSTGGGWSSSIPPSVLRR